MRGAMSAMASSSVDIVLLTNGPGEVVTWVRPVVRALRGLAPEAAPASAPMPEQAQGSARISVVLAPCPYASGQEADAVRRIPGVDRVARPEWLPGLLRSGDTPAGWDWRRRGVVVFLGGERANTLKLARRLNYPSLIYAERDLRRLRQVDAMALRVESLLRKVPRRLRDRVRVVGDLVADTTAGGAVDAASRAALNARLGIDEATRVIGLLPGSKDAKLTQGVPFVLGVAREIARRRPDVCLLLPLAPTLTLDQLLDYADPARNPMVKVIGGPRVRLLPPTRAGTLPCLVTDDGLRVQVWDESPAADALTRCDLALTTVGAVTAELGVLAVPMLVFFLTHKLDALNTWTGVTGRVTGLAIIGVHLRRLVNRAFFTWIRFSKQRFAWPNLWAKADVVPELLGAYTPAQGADLILDYLDDSPHLAEMSAKLQTLRAPAGASARLADLIFELAGGQAPSSGKR